MLRIVEVIVKEMDSKGRISIPIQWRGEWKSRKLALIKRERRIEILPLEFIPPSSLFDSIETSRNVDFTDSHSLKRALLELQES